MATRFRSILTVEADRLLDGLDPDQRKAVTTEAEPLAILAGPGSGKTRVLTRRIAHRCLTGSADARHVLAVTFTRKAASELDARLSQFGLRDLPAAGTFHALAYAQLRSVWASDGRTAPTILDRKARILGQVMGSSRRVRAVDLATEIEWAKSRLISPERYEAAVAATGRQAPIDPGRVSTWYRAYEEQKRKRGVVDFDDLLALAAARIEQDPSFAAAQRWRFRHLFVDEYQDVNPLQERLLQAWLGEGTDLCVVGDPDQSIYSWNGADASYLVDFAVHHPGAEVVRLDHSYRSTPQVLAVAGALIAGPSGRRFEAHRSDGPVPVVTGYHNDRDEAAGVARVIRELHRPGRPWSAQAILVRTHAQAALFEEALLRAAIPYRVRGGSRLVDDAEAAKVLDAMGRNRGPLVSVLDDMEAAVAERREAVPGGSSAADPTTRAELPGSAEAHRIEVHEQLIRLGREMLAADPGAPANAFPGWLRTMLVSDTSDRGDAVTIATFHAAKGLEWDVVHIAGCEVGYVPISHARTAAARAEEVRLFYVAATRAAEALRFTWAQQRTFTTEPVDRAPSPLLNRVRDVITDLGRSSRTATDSSAALVRARRALTPGPDDVERAIASDLRAWRDRQARNASVSPTVILSDRGLDALARKKPRSSLDLEGVAGLGPIARTRHGDKLLAIVAVHLHDDRPSDDPGVAP